MYLFCFTLIVFLYHHDSCLIRNKNCLPFASTVQFSMSSVPVFLSWGPCCPSVVFLCFVFYFDCIRPRSFVPNVAYVSELSIIYYPFGSLLRLLPLRFSITFITPSVLYYVYYPFGSLLRLLPLRFSLTFILFVDMIHDICLLFMKITVPN